ncbi:hypothetical protein [Alloalcanivorax mobilis]|uniref:hypothetical protein n=1 Tax=Alloalcanivorax mobilis TaxID=2019569 RepID=UPI000C759678|nr:hypothetical protein [Alloalcanivorax mobilis]
MKPGEQQRRDKTDPEVPEPVFYMPAMPPLKLLNSMERRVRAWWRRRRESLARRRGALEERKKQVKC